MLFGSYVVRLLLLYVVSPGTVSAFYYFVRARKQMSVPCEHIACAMTVNTKVNERVARVGSELKHTGGKKSVESRRANNPSRKKCSFFRSFCQDICLALRNNNHTEYFQISVLFLNASCECGAVLVYISRVYLSEPRLLFMK